MAAVTLPVSRSSLASGNQYHHRQKPAAAVSGGVAPQHDVTATIRLVLGSSPVGRFRHSTATVAASYRAVGICRCIGSLPETCAVIAEQFPPATAPTVEWTSLNVAGRLAVGFASLEKSISVEQPASQRVYRASMDWGAGRKGGAVEEEYRR